ncbi:hypothetical protein CL656_02500 [bacterium]|nr:hypothetical protein [bacterium]
MIFQFIDFKFNRQTFILKMEYSYSGLDFNFKESLDFSEFKSADFNYDDLYEAFKILFLVSGISYYKLYACAEIDLCDLVINKEQADFLNFFYKNGLSEFIYTNRLDFEKNIPDFTKYAKDYDCEPLRGNFLDKSLLAWGGGKDSIVSSILLDRLNLDYDLFAVKSDRIKDETAKINGNTFYEVKRSLDSRLMEYNLKDETFNGHVPITGILAFIKVLVSLMKGYNNIILSNEFSADEANLSYQGNKINHQFSKGLEFEERINSYIQKFIHSKLNYFSLLRPFYELKIAEIFAQNAQDYFSVFSSCNRNFHFDSNKNIKSKNFCGECEKCAFVFLILSPFLSKKALIEIFKENLFENKSLELVYLELCGLADKKPFECVGTFDESKAAFVLLKNHPDWKDSDFVLSFIEKIADFDVDSFFQLQNSYTFNSEWYLKIKDEFK